LLRSAQSAKILSVIHDIPWCINRDTIHSTPARQSIQIQTKVINLTKESPKDDVYEDISNYT